MLTFRYVSMLYSQKSKHSSVGSFPTINELDDPPSSSDTDRHHEHVHKFVVIMLFS